MALRRYVSCRITNDDLDDVDVDWRDRGAVAVKQMAWSLYDDMSQHYAKGRHALRGNVRKEIARWILFLRSDLEYLWPEYSFMQVTAPMANIFTFGWYKRRKDQRLEEFKQAGDFDYWPFISKGDFDEENRGLSRTALS